MGSGSYAGGGGDGVGQIGVRDELDDGWREEDKIFYKDEEVLPRQGVHCGKQVSVQLHSGVGEPRVAFITTAMMKSNDHSCM
jgi:hypothetical protein